MASYSPPTEDLAIFDSSVFLSGDEALTYNQAVKKFLRYPTAQGTQNLITTNVYGVLSAYDDVVFSPSTKLIWAPTTENYLINGSSNPAVTGNDNVCLGIGSLENLTAGLDNIALGKYAARNLTTGSQNICIGYISGYDITTGTGNTITGYYSGSDIEGDSNTIYGSQCNTNHTLGDRNVSIGFSANNLGTDVNFTDSTAVGSNSSNNNFSNSVALGAGSTNTSANQIRLGTASETVSCPNDVSIDGDLILASATEIQWDPAGRNYIINETLPKTITSGTDNVAMGRNCLSQVTSGQNNIGFGNQSAQYITSGSDNIAIGDLALSAVGSTLAFSNIAIGTNSLSASTTVLGVSAQGNVAIGTESGDANTTGRDNVYLGRESGATSTTVSRSTALGYQADCANFDDSTALGSGAVCTAANQIRLGKSTQTVSCPGTLTLKMASDNTNGTYYIPFSKVAGGTEGALFVDDTTGPLTYNPSTATLTTGSLYLTTGGAPTFILRPNGMCTLPSNSNLFFSSRVTPPSTGVNNVGIGTNSGNSLVNGNNNVLLGLSSGAALTSGSNNFALGAGALQSLQTGSGNVALGYSSMLLATGGCSRNVCIGYETGTNIQTTTNGDNVLVGYTTGKSITTGSSNTCIGYNANGTGNTTLTNSCALGANSTNANFSSSVALGAGSTNTSANQIRLGTASETVSCPNAIIVDGLISTSITTAPTSTRNLGYVYTKTTGWTTSAINTTLQIVNSFTIDGSTIAYGTYLVRVLVNIDNGAGSSVYTLACNTGGTITTQAALFHIDSNTKSGYTYMTTVSQYGSSAIYNIFLYTNTGTGTLITGTGIEDSEIILTRIA